MESEPEVSLDLVEKLQEVFRILGDTDPEASLRLLKINSAVSPAERWLAVLQHARMTPSMYIDSASIAHQRVLKEPIEIVSRTGMFPEFERCLLKCSPNNFMMLFYCAGLRREFDERVEWDIYSLADGFHVLYNNLRKMRELRELWQVGTNRAVWPSLEIAMGPVYFSNEFWIAVKTQSGYRFQSFDHGVPIAPVELIGASSQIGLAISAKLSNAWFTGLPYNEADIKELIPVDIKHKIILEWYDSDEALLSPAQRRDVFEFLSIS